MSFDRLNVSLASPGRIYFEEVQAKRFLGVLGSCLTVTALFAASDDVMEIKGEINGNGLVLTLDKTKDPVDKNKLVGV